MSDIPTYVCETCKGYKIVRSIIPSRTAGYLDSICADCNGTGMKQKPQEKLPSLNIEQLRPYLGELNWILKDYGVCIIVPTDDETGEVQLKDGVANIKIGKPHKWTQIEPSEQENLFLNKNIIQSQQYCSCIRTLELQSNPQTKCGSCGKRILY